MGPLAGLRVLDLGRFMAAPWCGQMLGDLGADVIKVERPNTGDQFREYGPPFLADADGQETTESSYFVSTNRNKRSVTANIATVEGRELVRRLALRSDVLIENFKVGDLARAGLDYNTLRPLHPELVYCSVTGFGQEGPYAARPGLDSVFQAMSGLMSVTGEPDGPPQKVGVVIIDQIAGLYAAIAILAALRHRDLGNGGQHIDLALLDTAIAMMSHRAQDYLLTGEVPVRSGSRTLGSAPAQLFRCRDGLLNIQAGDDRSFRKLCTILDVPDLSDDPRFSVRTLRWRNREALLPLLEAAFACYSTIDLYARCTADNIICAPVYNFGEIVMDPHVIARNIVRDIAHPHGPLPILANPIRYSETLLDTYSAPPQLGEHNREIWGDNLGIDSAVLEDFITRGII